MRLDQRGLNFIKKFEGCRLTAYYDSAHIPTIGYGTTVIDGALVQMGTTITQEQADQYLAADCASAEYTVNKMISDHHVSLTQNMFNALVSFVYNVGAGGFGRSTLRAKLVNKEPVVEDYFLRWNKITDPSTGQLVVSKGLTNRRHGEYVLFTTP